MGATLIGAGSSNVIAGGGAGSKGAAGAAGGDGATAGDGANAGAADPGRDEDAGATEMDDPDPKRDEDDAGGTDNETGDPDPDPDDERDDDDDAAVTDTGDPDPGRTERDPVWLDGIRARSWGSLVGLVTIGWGGFASSAKVGTTSVDACEATVSRATPLLAARGATRFGSDAARGGAP